ncbi:MULTISPECIES: EAL domain-containing protein [unclassified Sphingomonas]|uniref:putative bifunctional diguanylate cyclase/phosphodiesterase n=1 Tax=unclassified Sphingomonas TaxID=196159 RepID=UPI00226A16BB|nr:MULTISPECIES: EAL domain-containing protein [unclassified Sphingomonas]
MKSSDVNRLPSTVLGSFEARRELLADYQMEDCTPEAEFDHIVALAAKFFGVSGAMISMVTADVTLFKARIGLDVCMIESRHAFCPHALDLDSYLVIEDTLEDARFSDNPLVTGKPHIRFYAGTPLRLAAGHAIGTLCVIDSKPRMFSDHERQLLQGLGQLVIDRLEKRRQEQQLAQLAHFDTLTGLPNRALLYRRAGELLAAQHPLAVLMFDLDGFKDVNDLFGHVTGDALLSAIGHRLSSLLTDDQMLARLGGDEFVVLAPDTGDPRAAWTVADRLRSAFDEGFVVNGQELRLNTCIGVALSPYHGGSIDDLVCHADLALYRAKERGCGSIAFYEPHLRHQVEHRQRLQHELRRAFERDEFELFYQPQVRLADEKIVGMEALLRWRHPDHGLLTPAQFLPILELMPLAVSVGRWALDTAVAQAAHWHASGQRLRVAINLFASQFRGASLVEDVASALARHRLPAELIELELTEDFAGKNIRTIVDTLKALRQLGVGIALDDFGTGRASLNVLREFPLTRLKIDRGFISDIAVGAEQSAIVGSILTLGRAFGLPIIAEGIEHPVQARWLRAKGCEEVQGWHYGKAMSASAVGQLIGVSEAAKGCA